MESNEFKIMFKRYKLGIASDQEEKLIENELEKLDEYQAFLEEEFSIPDLEDLEIEKSILKRSKLTAYLRIGVTILIVVLLFLPTLNVLMGIYNNFEFKNSLIHSILNGGEVLWSCQRELFY